MIKTAILTAFFMQASPAASQPGPTAGEMRYLKTEIDTALLSNSRTGTNPPLVKVEGKTILLTGDVYDPSTRAIIDNIVRRATSGYDVEIVNKVRVMDAENRPNVTAVPTELDEKQMEELRAVLREQFPMFADNITVSFEIKPLPMILLEGLIPAYDQKVAVSKVVRQRFPHLTFVNNIAVRRHRAGDTVTYNVTSDDPAMVVVDKGNRATPVEGSDQELANKLAARLKDDPLTENFKVTITVEDGVVWMSGEVTSVGQKGRAIRIVESYPGVRYVIDRMSVAGISPAPSVAAASTTVNTRTGDPVPPRADPAPAVTRPAPIAPVPVETPIQANTVARATGAVRTDRMANLEDARVFVRRYLSRNFPEVATATITANQDRILVTLPVGSSAEESRLIGEQLRGLPSLDGYEVQVRPLTQVDTAPAPAPTAE